MNTNKKTATAKTSQKSNTAPRENDPMLQDFFHDELKDIYWAEKHLTKAIPKMIKAACSDELKNAFTDHLQATKNHVTRLEQVFEMLGKKPQAKKCEAMDGITKEAEGIIEDTEQGTSTRDVGLIIAAQKVEHYEIATYGGLAQVATTLQLEDIAAILRSTLKEEKEADTLLTSIAENDINYAAAEESAEA